MIFVCLGNKGEKYKNTRHNVGRMFGKYLLENFESSLEKENGNKIWQLENDWQVVYLNCYMNNSGSCLKGLLKILKLKIENLCVVHDDLDIPFGEFRIQTDRGSAGHRGVESVINALVSSDFKRIRIGIGRDPKIPEEKYVLIKFTKEEKKQLDKVFENILVKLEE